MCERHCIAGRISGKVEEQAKRGNTMTQIVLDDSLRSKLNGLNEHIPLVDENGQLAGGFLPAKEYHRWMYDQAMKECPYTEEEWERFRKETGGVTLKQVWKQLGVE